MRFVVALPVGVLAGRASTPAPATAPLRTVAWVALKPSEPVCFTRGRSRGYFTDEESAETAYTV
ncbi:MAG: hypothetical protein WAK84_05230 [Candidatus Cybelea sp.]